MTKERDDTPLRILVAALGGEGGGVLMNWIVESARNAGFAAQATSVPGVAQRTGSTSYYIEVTCGSGDSTLSLVPVPGRVDVLLSSELVETARAMTLGFVSPRLTTVISSTARTYTTSEKIALGDGRFEENSARRAVCKMAKTAHLLDLGELARRHGTFISATLFGALAGSRALPWKTDNCRAVLGDSRSATASLAGFDAAAAAIQARRDSAASDTAPDHPVFEPLPDISNCEALSLLPAELRNVLAQGAARCLDFQDSAFAKLYLERSAGLARAADLGDHTSVHALGQAFRRLALWMAYEDVARVADLKTRPERYARIREETKLEPDQTITVTEYLKPRAEELADILPAGIGARLMARVAAGRSLPGLGRGMHVRSNGVLGYWILRSVAAARVFRRRSYRYQREQRAIAEWLDIMQSALRADPPFAEAFAELPRVLKGYSDTYARGLAAYERIMDRIARPASQTLEFDGHFAWLRASIAAALADETHTKLDAALASPPEHGPPPEKRKADSTAAPC